MVSLNRTTHPLEIGGLTRAELTIRWIQPRALNQGILQVGEDIVCTLHERSSIRDMHSTVLEEY